MADNLKFLPVSASNLSAKSRLCTGIPQIDLQLEGGLPTNGIIEICGESASGKSQLCLQLSLMSQLGGKQNAVIYICTEDTFPSKRLQQLIQALSTKTSAVDFGSNIFVEHAADFASLKDCLTQKVPKLFKYRSVTLLIIDSVAALFRGTYGTGQGGHRTQDLRTLGGILLKINVESNVAVVCVNQVAACLATDRVVPALGLAWANMIATRIQLRRHPGAVRSLQVLFSPSLSPCQLYFKITPNGLEDYQVT